MKIKPILSTILMTVFIAGVGNAWAGLISLPKTGQTKCYDQSGAERPCSGTGADGDIQAGVGWPQPRFQDNGDGTVTDRLTGLMWLQDTSCLANCFEFNGTTWIGAIYAVEDFNKDPRCPGFTATYADWRLPNVNELASILNFGEPDSAAWLMTQGFSNVSRGDDYWTSTYMGRTQWSDNNYRTVYLGSNRIEGSREIDPTNRCWAVRAGARGQPDNAYPANVWKTSTDTWGVDWPAERFHDNGNGTITDELTGLVWTQDMNAPGPPECSPGKAKNWQQSLEYVECLNSNGYLAQNDWRLPNIRELQSLFNNISNKFVNVKSEGGYWSSDTSLSRTTRAYYLDLTFNAMIHDDSKGYSKYVCAVRGGSAQNPQLTSACSLSAASLSAQSLFTATYAIQSPSSNPVDVKLGLTFSGPATYDFPFVQRTIQPGSSTQTVSYEVPASLAPGTYNVAWGIHKSDETQMYDYESKANYLTIGVGAAPEISVIGSSVNFGTAPTNTTSEPRTLILSNTGTGQLVVNSISVAGTDAQMFSVTPGGLNPCTSLTPTLDAGKGCTVVATFSPSSAGMKTALIAVASNAANAPSRNVLLEGIGGAAASGLQRFSFSRIPGGEPEGAPFWVEITAWDASGNLVDFNGMLNLSSNAGLVSPTQVTLTGGRWSGSVKVDNPGLVILRVYDPTSARYWESDSFSVGTIQYGTVAGYIRDENRNPLQGARVYMISWRTGELVSTPRQIGPDGTYMFKDVVSGYYYLWAQYSTVTSSRNNMIYVPPGRTTTENLEVQMKKGARTPIVLVPGILGSTSKYADTIFPQFFWAFEERQEDLRLLDPWGAVGWEALREELRGRDVDITDCPWDWRVPLAAAAQKYLIPAIDRAKDGDPAKKINIVAHSMGGLLVRAYIQGPSYRGDIDSFVMIGTPNKGASKAYYLWEGGDPARFDGVLFPVYLPTMRALYQDTYGLGILQDDDYVSMKSMMHRYVPSLRELLPTYPFLKETQNSTAHPISTSGNTNDFLNSLNSDNTRLERMTPMSSGDTSKVRTRVYYSESENTLRDLVATKNLVSPWQDSDILYEDGVPQQSQEVPRIGDGTVPSDSASLPCSEGWADYGTIGEENKPVEGKHSELVGKVVKDVTDKLYPLPTGAQGLSRAAGRQAAAVPSSQLYITVRGSVQPLLTGPTGAQVGISSTDGTLVNTFPGAQVQVGVISSSSVIDNPKEGTYTLSLTSPSSADVGVGIAFGNSAGTSYMTQRWFCGSSLSFSFVLQPTNSEAIKLADTEPLPPTIQADALMPGDLKTRVVWSPTIPPVSSYRVYSRQIDEPYFSLIGTTTGTYFDTGDLWSATPSVKPRLYAVSAVNSGGKEGPLSNLAANDDRDHDGVTDAEEAAYGTNPAAADSDGDGLKDGQERNYGTHPFKADTDGDGYSDYQEVLGGSDPRNSSSIPASCVFSITPASGTFGAAGGVGAVNVIATLASCSWTAIPSDSWITVTSGNDGKGNGTVTYTVSANTGASSRVGTITIAEQQFTITQGGAQAETVSTPGIPGGPYICSVVATCTFSTARSSSNLGHQIEYQFDWAGDGTVLSSFGAKAQSKAFVTAGTYNVRARARCALHTSAVSEWSAPHPVSVSPPSADWVPVSLPEVSSDWRLTGVHFTSPNEGWAVGANYADGRGVLFHYLNGTWTTVSPPNVSTSWYLTGVHFTSPNEGWAVGYDYTGDKGAVLHYLNGTWTAVSPPNVSTSWELTGVHFTSPNEGWAVGDGVYSGGFGGVLLHYLDGTWTAASPPNVSTYWMLDGVHFTSPNEGWAVGRDRSIERGLLLRYFNGTWTSVSLPEFVSVLSLNAIVFTSPGEGWTVGYDYTSDKAVLLHYLNGTWTVADLPNVSSDWSLAGVHFTSPDEGWAVGRSTLSNNPAILLHYLNGTWTAVNPPNVSTYWALVGVHFTSATEGWAVGYDNPGNKGVLLKYSRGSGSSVSLAKTGQHRCYNSLGVESSCSGTGQDGGIQAGVEWPDPRFTNPGGTAPITDTVVLDRLTGLLWARDAGTPSWGPCSGGAKTWPQALDYVSCLNTHQYRNRDKWRLPNINELESLLNPDDISYMWLNEQGFNNTSPDYWSSTTYAYDTGLAWGVGMWNDQILGYDKSSSLDVWVVHSGPLDAPDIRYPANLWKTGQRNSFHTGDDGDLEWGVAWPANRFTDQNDGTVADNLTNLMWTKDSSTPGPSPCLPGAEKSWQEALDYVSCLNINKYLGFRDWRLPNRRELMTLVDRAEQAPVVPKGHPFLVEGLSDRRWSSTSVELTHDYAFVLNLYDGSISWVYGYKPGRLQVWPVRTQTGTSSPINGQCGSADKGTFNTAPTTNLCTAGSPGTVSGSGSWSWSCQGENGGKDATCSANIKTWTVTPSAVGNGTISPNTPQTVNNGATKSFTITPNTNYTATVSGTCGGTLNGTTYTTNAVTKDCTVVATFTIKTWTVTPSAGPNGTISPSTVQTVNHNATTSFTVNPAAGYSASVSGTCGGSPASGTASFTYTTNAVTTNCAVTVTFSPVARMVTKDYWVLMPGSSYSYTGGVKTQVTSATFPPYVTEPSLKQAEYVDVSSQYEVWGGNTPISGENGYRPEDHGYVLLGKASSTQTFAGSYKYYGIVTRPFNVALVDTVQGSNGQLYWSYTTGNTPDWSNFGGPPDGKSATVGGLYPAGQWGGYIVIDATGLSLSSVTVYIGGNGSKSGVYLYGHFFRYDFTGALQLFAAEHAGEGFSTMSGTPPAIIPAELEVGKEYSAPYQAQLYDNTGSPSATESGIFKVVVGSQETVTVPAGAFVTYKLTITDTWSDSKGNSGNDPTYYWLAKNVGIVKRVEYDGSMFELLSYTIGTQPTVQFSNSIYAVSENAGSITITVTLGATSDQQVKVNYATSDNTAKAGEDYTATSGTLTFAPGDTSKTFTIPITPDTKNEPSETVILTLSSAVNATLGLPSQATLTIQDADTTGPSLSIISHTNTQHVTTSSITLSGTASDSGKGDNGIQQVTVNGNRANSDTATGSVTASWSKPLTLVAGANTLSVIASDNSSNHNGTTQTITIYYDAPVNGICGTAAGQTLTAAPASNLLCTKGTASAVTGTGPWTWTCAGANGGADANCTANIKTWNVTPSAGGNGTISPTAAQTVNHGSTKSLTVTPSAGYTASMGGTCGGSPSSGAAKFTYTTNPITSNCTVTATFTPNQFPLAVSKSGSSSGAVTSNPSGIICGTTCSYSYNYNTSVTLTAAPDVSSTFTGWSGEGCSGTGTCTVTMTAARNVIATFTISEYTVTGSVPGGGGTISCTSPVSHGSNSTCTMSPSIGYRFVTLTDNGTDVYSQVSKNTYTIAYVTSPHTIAATFIRDYPAPVYRFYNTATGTHFYTILESEKDLVIGNMPSFIFEGPKFYAYTSQVGGTSPVYRFYNTATGTHFYTISETEKNTVIQRMPSFIFEGPKFYAYPSQQTGTLPVYRFYNTATGTHFYTISEDEKNWIIRNLPSFIFEGPKFYAYPPCAPTLSPSEELFGVVGGPGTVTVTTGDWCTWAAATSAPWITNISPASGSGTQTISYGVAANTGACARREVITIGGETFTAKQAGSVQSVTAEPVYRFYNTATGTHFYTILENEKNLVIQTMPSFFYEGPKFYAYATQEAGTSPVYRFYNTATGTHFYTILESEKNLVIQNMPSFIYEGPKFYAYVTQEACTSPVYRFYNTATGTHFYTILESEKNLVIQNMPSFIYEGPKFYAYTDG